MFLLIVITADEIKLSHIVVLCYSVYPLIFYHVFYHIVTTRWQSKESAFPGHVVLIKPLQLNINGIRVICNICNSVQVKSVKLLILTSRISPVKHIM